VPLSRNPRTLTS